MVLFGPSWMSGAEEHVVQACTDGAPRLDHAIDASAKMINCTSTRIAGHEALQTGGDLLSDASAAALRQCFLLLAWLGVDEVLHLREKSTELASSGDCDEYLDHIKSMPAACMVTHPVSRDLH
jgi:hypothetical protein